MRLVRMLLLAAALVAGCDSGDEDDSRPAPEPPPPAITQAELAEHLDALGRAAAENGGNRAVGTAGYEASVEYVSSALRAAGWRVRVQKFDVPRFELESSSVSVGGRRLDRAHDYRATARCCCGWRERPRTRSSSSPHVTDPAPAEDRR